MKLIVNLLRKIIFSSFLLYSYNLLAVPLKIIIPINILNIGIISFLGIPSLFSLILIHVLIF